MIIDPSKVNLAERDIEDYLYENPWLVDIENYTVYMWIKRQYAVPSGIVDLIGLTADREIVVVEIKNTAIDAGALAQVSRYAWDIERIRDIIYFESMGETDLYICPPVRKVVVGKSIDAKTMLEAEAIGVCVVLFSVNLSLDTHGPSWRKEYSEERTDHWRRLSGDSDLVNALEERIELFLGEQSEECGKEVQEEV